MHSVIIKLLGLGEPYEEHELKLYIKIVKTKTKTKNFWL